MTAKPFSDRVRALFTVMLFSGLSPVLHFISNRRQGRYHKQHLLYSFLPRLEFLFPKDSVLRSFGSFLNWGFYPTSHVQLFTDFVSNLPSSQQKYPYGAYHYYHLLHKGYPDNKSILEVGCGKGSGCKYVVAPFFSPTRYVGLDLSSHLINMCKRHNLDKRFEFVEGAALNLPFSSDSFDMVLNVESSHCYPSFKTFLREVERVLRPDGQFLFADLRWGWGNDIKKTLERQLNSTNMELVAFAEITKNIVAARKLVSKQITSMDRKVFKYNQAISAHYCLEGSTTFEMLQNGTILYFEAILQKRKNRDSSVTSEPEQVGTTN